MTDGVDLAALVEAGGAGAELLGPTGTRPGEVGVTSVTHDSRRVEPGGLFVCLRGGSFDGHDFAADAVAAGAVALLVDHRLDLDVAQLVVADTRIAAGPVAAEVLGRPADRLVTVGITGTNGKTTTSQLLAAMLEAAGHRTGIVGTLHGPRTTPEAADLQATLAGFVADGLTAAVLEVSSHALALHRVDGTSFDVVAFTNLGRDHLELHGSTEEYFRAKSRLFDGSFSDRAVICVDDTHGRLLADTVERCDGCGVAVTEVSIDQVEMTEITPTSHRYRWRGRDVAVSIGGEVNVRNSLLALEIAATLGLDLDAAVPALATVPAVPGRFETVVDPAADELGVTVLVDYAHTPDGLETLLDSVRPLTGGEVRLVFGCGGERDPEKRPKMGEIAARLADSVVVTSDNPRRERPEAIIDDVMSGVDGEYRARVVVEADRATAIELAVDGARAGDLVVIAGKGHERTQDLGDEVVDFDDRLVARSALGAVARRRRHPQDHPPHDPPRNEDLS